MRLRTVLIQVRIFESDDACVFRRLTRQYVSIHKCVARTRRIFGVYTIGACVRQQQEALKRPGIHDLWACSALACQHCGVC